MKKAGTGWLDVLFPPAAMGAIVAVIGLELAGVSLFRDGQLVKLSKRSGDSVTLDELIEEVGVDASRYFFLMRSPQ